MSSISSYTWRSILSARELFKKGLKKVVGNGNDVNIWDDPGVPKFASAPCFSQVERIEEGPNVVSDLMVDK